MTRKDYVLLAEALRDSQPTEPEQFVGWSRAVIAIMTALKGNNPRFSTELFTSSAIRPIH